MNGLKKTLLLLAEYLPRFLLPGRNHSATTLLQTAVVFAFTGSVNALGCSCPPGMIPVELQSPNSYYKDPDRCGKPPTEAGPKKCWRWESWPQKCMWLGIGDPAGYADEYRKKCPGVVRVDYSNKHSCVLPPSQSTCLCVNMNLHVPACEPGEIGISQQGRQYLCLTVMPPTQLSTQHSVDTISNNVSYSPICEARDPNNCECPP